MYKRWKEKEFYKNGIIKILLRLKREKIKVLSNSCKEQGGLTKGSDNILKVITDTT